ncbi:hypothetical protein DAEQUDRAFT_732468 [Daedalea quercina L-15889]|uniref:Uncharacterized protein n=1 Tax=Daedalea quercina L-15889 TaxID=1314783 RepID=A0A165LKD9_9APHY|nr:hypothetical protein DAEQUDRAFT_732468 [Daedalea quercina L-15889]
MELEDDEVSWPDDKMSRGQVWYLGPYESDEQTVGASESLGGHTKCDHVIIRMGFTPGANQILSTPNMLRRVAAVENQ